jgi:Dolichyl-phosphate-mannose-protein mannosyltransferase
MSAHPNVQAAAGPSWCPAGRTLLIALVGYLTAHMAVRLLLSPSLIPDEADVALFSQSFAWGYSEQPPLYSWLVCIVVRALGLSVFTVTLVKLVVLGLIFLVHHTVARQVVRDERLALLAAGSLFLLPTFAWNSVNYLTHTLLLCVIALAVVHRVLVLPERRWWGSYALLGLFVGLGVLSKYNFVVLAAALFLAVLACPPYRRCLLDWRLLLAGAVAALVVLPHFLWAMEHREEIWGLLAAKTGVGEGGSLHGLWKGMWNLLVSNIFLLVLPLVGTLALVFRPGLKPLWEPPVARSDGCRLLERFFLATLVLLTLQVLGGTTRFHERWLQPFVLLVPVWLFSRLQGISLPRYRVRAYVAVLGCLALLVTGGQAARIWLGSVDDGVYPLQMSFDEASEQLSDEGFGRAAIVTSDRVVGGNLCLCFPRARVFCAWHPGYHPPAPTMSKPCFAVWHLNMGAQFPAVLQEYASQSFPRPMVPHGPVGIITVPPLLPGRNTNYFGYVRLIPASPGSTAEAEARPHQRPTALPGI